MKDRIPGCHGGDAVARTIARGTQGIDLLSVVNDVRLEFRRGLFDM